MGIYNGEHVAQAIVNPHTDLPRVGNECGTIGNECGMSLA